MFKNIKIAFYFASVIVFGSVFLYSCEPDADNLGEQFFDGADGNELSYDVVAYNIKNNDTLRTDALEIPLGVLGVFSESIFGSQKANYISQLRPKVYNPDFGSNAVVDSVVMVLKPQFASDTIKVSTDENYIYPDGNINAKKVVNSYPVYKFGKTKINGATNLNIRVHEVTDFLGANTDVVFSNKYVALGSEIGHKTFDGYVRSNNIIKDEDGSSLWSNEASLRIPLNSSFFQSKIINVQGGSELKDAANFIRHFRGVSISVDESNGYLFKFSPDTAEIVVYYTYDNVSSGASVRTQSKYVLSMGNPNMRFGQYIYDRKDTPVAAIPSTPNTNGDAKIFMQGMGGPSMGIRIPSNVIESLKEQFKKDKIGIISAKIRIYSDEISWNNSYTKPSNFVLLQQGVKSFLPEIGSYGSLPQFRLVKPYDLDRNPSYYDLTITKTLKEIIEKEASNKDFILHAGDFRVNSDNQLYGYNYDSRAYTTDRVVLVGSDNSNPRKIQLKLIYGTK